MVASFTKQKNKSIHEPTKLAQNYFPEATMLSDIKEHIKAILKTVYLYFPPHVSIKFHSVYLFIYGVLHEMLYYVIVKALSDLSSFCPNYCII